MRFFKRPDGRTYAMFAPAQDLLGDWVIVTIHGSENSRLGGIKTYVAADQEAAKRAGEGIAKLRRRHGYIEVQPE